MRELVGNVLGVGFFLLMLGAIAYMLYQHEQEIRPLRVACQHDIDTLVDRAEQGDVNAWYQAGVKYLPRDFEGPERGCPRDFDLATDYLIRAAKAGDTNAQCALGEIIADGADNWEDNLKAISWYQKAAESGHPGAQARLGDLLISTGPTAENYRKGVTLFLAAAEKGHPTAYLRLGMIYSGEGLEPDLLQAYIWGSLGAIHYPYSKAIRDVVEKSLTRQQLIDAHEIIWSRQGNSAWLAFEC